MRADDGAVGPLDGAWDKSVWRAVTHKVAVVARCEADVHALGLVRGRKLEARRDCARLRLVAQLADRKLDPRKLALAEHVERVRLVLRRISRTEQVPTAVAAGRDAGVVPGRESIPAELPDHGVQQRVALDLLGAGDARTRSLATRLRIHEAVDDPLAEGVRVVEGTERDSDGQTAP